MASQISRNKSQSPDDALQSTAHVLCSSPYHPVPATLAPLMVLIWAPGSCLRTCGLLSPCLQCFPPGIHMVSSFISCPSWPSYLKLRSHLLPPNAYLVSALYRPFLHTRYIYLFMLFIMSSPLKFKLRESVSFLFFWVCFSHRCMSSIYKSAWNLADTQ